MRKDSAQARALADLSRINTRLIEGNTPPVLSANESADPGA